MMRFAMVAAMGALTILSAGRGNGAYDRPNILWLTSEDNGPHLGAYGDAYADTPNLDRLAAKGTIYLNAWSTAPVCAPARTTIITGVYPPSTGSQHMRSSAPLPPAIKMYPQYLRQAGYYCTNNVKEDYNVDKPGQVWDESSRQAHWKNRGTDQPFFAIFNFTISHESQIRKRPHTPIHDPAKVTIPAYHPDTPEVRLDWAQYHDKMTEMDALAGEKLRELAEAGLADDTIVFYYGDHGPGMPRSKRWTYNSGLRVPLIVYVPEKFRRLAAVDYSPGGESDRLVGFIDLAPTLLSLAGLRPPDVMQGHAFMGDYEAPPQPYLFAFRDRMDERYDMVRSVRNKRYLFIRNYMPHRAYGQYLSYMFQTPTTVVWKKLYDEGKLKPPQTYFWEKKPPEELYDLDNDPDEIRNLVASPDHREVLAELRRAQRNHARRIRDLGFLPEAEIHSRAADSTPYEMGLDEAQYPLLEIMEVAEAAAGFDAESIPLLKVAFNHDDSAVRFWAAIGILAREKEGAAAAETELRNSLNDASPYVRIVAAEALGRFGEEADARLALKTLMELAPLDKNGIFTSVLALNSLDMLDARAAPAIDAIRALPRSDPAVIRKMRNYVPRLIEKILADLESP